MKALILAAGMGTRLKELTKEKNKCALLVANKPMITHIVDPLIENGISDIYVTTGHNVESVKEVLGDKAEYIHNPIYHAAGILVSLWVARDKVASSELIWSTADNMFKPEVLPRFLATQGDIVVAVKKKFCEARDVKVRVEGNKIVEFEENMDPSLAIGEFGMICRFSPTASAALYSTIQEFLSNQKTNATFYSVLNALIQKGFTLTPFYIEENESIEIDTPEDLMSAEKLMTSTSPFIESIDDLKPIFEAKVTEPIQTVETIYDEAKETTPIISTNFKGAILSAGVGSRLKELTKFRNKGSMKIGGKSMVRRVVDLYKANNIEDIHIVTGYHNELIEEDIGSEAKYTHNPMYRSAGILVSLWLLKDKLNNEQTILSTSDYISDPKVFPEFLKTEGDVVIAVRRKECKDNDVKVKVHDGKISKLEHDIPLRDSVGEFAMMIKLNKKATQRLFGITKNFLTQERTNARIIDVLNTMIVEGYNLTPFFIETHQGIEVNSFEDLEEAEKLVKRFDATHHP